MTESKNERRMAENEVVFRRYNESVQKGFDRIKQIAKDDKQEHLLIDDDMPLQFYCECSDETCVERVLLTPSRYNKIHKHRNRFVIITGHETVAIEKITQAESEFNIVEKFIKPPESEAGLNTTKNPSK